MNFIDTKLVLSYSEINMSTVGQIERATQNRLVKLFQEQLGYRYVGNLEKVEDNSNLREADLRAFLVKQGNSNNLIIKAITDFKKP